MLRRRTTRLMTSMHSRMANHYPTYPHLSYITCSVECFMKPHDELARSVCSISAIFPWTLRRHVLYLPHDLQYNASCESRTFPFARITMLISAALKFSQLSSSVPLAVLSTFAKMFPNVRRSSGCHSWKEYNALQIYVTSPPSIQDDHHMAHMVRFLTDFELCGVVRFWKEKPTWDQKNVYNHLALIEDGENDEPTIGSENYIQNKHRK
ncbi:hypothetical protein K474DRAFT_450681 [Panus rudis PR-1116 ss-1]|nr:hypothetical protein K474DRAFT_450681 [Panus rudis PR-1116 ss-1]